MFLTSIHTVKQLKDKVQIHLYHFWRRLTHLACESSIWVMNLLQLLDPVNYLFSWVWQAYGACMTYVSAHVESVRLCVYETF
jgi:hypothetical protein